MFALFDLVRENWFVVLLAAALLYFSGGKVNVGDLFKSVVSRFTKKSSINDRDAIDACGEICKWLDDIEAAISATGSPMEDGHTSDQDTIKTIVRKNLMRVSK